MAFNIQVWNNIRVINYGKVTNPVWYYILHIRMKFLVSS